MSKKWSEAFVANPVSSIVNDDLVGIAQSNGSGGYISEANAAKWSTVLAYITDGLINPANSYRLATNGDLAGGDGTFNNPFATFQDCFTKLSPTATNPAVIIVSSGQYTETNLITKPNFIFVGEGENPNAVSLTVTTFDYDTSWSGAASPIFAISNITINGNLAFSLDGQSVTNANIFFEENKITGFVNLLAENDSVSNQATSFVFNGNAVTSSTQIRDCIAKVSDNTFLGAVDARNFSGNGKTDVVFLSNQMAIAFTATKTTSGVTNVTLKNSKPSSIAISGSGTTLVIDSTSFVTPTVTSSAVWSFSDFIMVKTPVTVGFGGKTLALSDMNVPQIVTAFGNITVPTNATTAFPIGTVIPFFSTTDNANPARILGAGGVSISGNNFLNNPGQIITLIKTGTNTWIASATQGVTLENIYYIGQVGSASISTGTIDNPFSSPVDAESKVSQTVPAVLISAPGTYTFSNLQYGLNREYIALAPNTVFWEDSSGAVTNNLTSWATVDGESIQFTNINFNTGTNFGINLSLSTVAAPAIMFLQNNYFGGEVLLQGLDNSGVSLAIRAVNNTYSQSPSIVDCSYTEDICEHQTNNLNLENNSPTGICIANIRDARINGIQLTATAGGGIVTANLVNSRPGSIPMIDGAGATISMDGASFVTPSLTTGGNFLLTDYLIVPNIVTVSGNKTFALSDLNTVQKCTASATLTVPPDLFPIGSSIPLRQTALGTVTLAPGAGVTFLDAAGTSINLTLSGSGYSGGIFQYEANKWIISGVTVP